MDNDSLLLALFISLPIIWVGIYFYSWKIKENQKNALSKDWIAFNKAISTNDIPKIIEKGEKLIQNPYLTPEKLSKISAFINAKDISYPELQKLEKGVLNKQAEWRRTTPKW